MARDVSSKSSDNLTNRTLAFEDSIIRVSIMDTKGNVLATRSKLILENKFTITSEAKANPGTSAIMVLGMAKEMNEIFGNT